MLKASRVLLKVAAILGTVLGAIFLASVPVFLVIGFSTTIRDMLIEAFNNGTISTTFEDASYETIVLVLQIVFISLGFVFLIIGGMCVANAIIASKTRNEPTRGRYIACIITGALSTDFSLVGGIFGLICLSRQQRKPEIEE